MTQTTPFSRVSNYLITALESSYNTFFGTTITSLAQVVAGLMVFVVMIYGYRLLTMSSNSPLRDGYIVIFKILVVYTVIIFSSTNIKDETKQIGGNTMIVNKNTDNSNSFYTRYIKKSWDGLDDYFTTVFISEESISSLGIKSVML